MPARVRARFLVLLFVAVVAGGCGGGGSPAASPAVTSPSAPPVATSPSAEDARTVFCGHVNAHVNTLLNVIASPATSDTLGLQYMNDQIKEFRPDVRQKEDAQVARIAKDFITSLQVLADATEADGLQQAVQEHLGPFADAAGRANELCA